MSLNHVRQLELRHRMQPGQLRAVIYYSDRSWTRVTIYGPAAVETAVRAMSAASQITRHPLASLKSLPQAAKCNKDNGKQFGVTDKVLLVSE